MGMMDLRRRILLDAPHKETATGKPAAFSTNLTLPAQKIVVNVGYTQDLNGYDYPWVAGSGYSKNMIPDTTDTSNGYEYQYRLNANGTKSTSTPAYISEYFAVEPDTVYTMSQKNNDMTTAAVCFYDSNKTYISGEAFDGRKSFTITSPSNAAYCRCSQYRRDIGPYIGGMAQMEPGSTASTVMPYSNVCPITGYNTVPIANRTTNIIPFENIVWNIGMYYTTSGTRSYNSSYKYSQTLIPVNPNTTYNAQFYRPSTSGAFRIVFFNSNQEYISIESLSTIGESLEGIRYGTFTTPSNAAYIRIGAVQTNVYNIQITEGLTNPTYTDINKQYNVTVYSNETNRIFYTGTLTINPDGTGTFARDYIGYICDGSDTFDTWSKNWDGTTHAVFRLGITGGRATAYSTSTSNSYCKSSHFRSGVTISSSTTNIGFVAYSGAVQFRPPNAADMTLTQWKTFLQNEYAKGTPLTVVYKISESSSLYITTELTAPEVRTVLGQNNFWSEAGNVTIDYWNH